MSAGGWIDAAWQDRGLQALRDTLDVDPRQRKVMVQFLYDEGFWDEKSLTWPAAIARWNDCLNPGKNSFFKLGELWALMARFGRHDLFLAMADDLGYEVRRKPTEERQQELMERLCTSLERIELVMGDTRSKMARLQAPMTDRPVSVLRQDQPARFSMDDGSDTGVCF